MKKVIETTKAPGAIGPYSQAIKTSGFVFTSGQLPVDPATGDMPHGAAEQARMCLQNLKAVVEEAGGTMETVLKTTVFIKHMDDFQKINEVYAEFFPQPYPARSCVEVAKLPKDALVEIECIAIVSNN